MKARFVAYLCFLLLFIYFFLVFETDFHGPDAPIYYAYTASMIEEGDLNVINNIDRRYALYFPLGEMRVSKTYNFTDFHGHGGVVLWAPFYIYAKVMHSLAGRFNMTGLTAYSLERFTECLMSFSTIVFGFFVLLLTYMLCRGFFSNKISLFSTLIICFGTPFFYFLLSEVGNSQMIASLFSVLSIWAVSYIIRMRKLHWFIYGLFFGICIVVKADIWAQIFFVLFLFVALLMLKQTTWKNGGFFLLGLIPACTLKVINDYIKYGTFHIGEIGVLNLKMSYLPEMLFSSYRGYFYTSPILYICLAGFLLVAVHSLKNIKTLSNIKGIDESKWSDLFIFILSSYLLMKIFIISRNYAWGGGTPGARTLLTEFPIFVILYARTLSAQKRLLKYFFFLISAVFVLWNLLVISEYMASVDLLYVVETPRLSVRIKSLKEILVPLFYFKDLKLKLSLGLLPMLIVSGIAFYIVMFSRKAQASFWHLRSHNSNNAFKMLCLFAIYLNISYACITFLNIRNNKKNVEKLKEKGFFKNAKILTSREFEKGENVGSMNEMIEYFTLKGDHERAYRIQRYKEEKYGEK